MAITYALGAGLAPILGGLFGSSQAEEDARKARLLQEQAARQYEDLTLPVLERIAMQEYAPEQEGVYTLGPSEYSNISVDPRYAAAQNESLAALQERGKTGFTDAERAQLEQALSEASRQEMAKRAAVTQEMARRGAGGSGAELAAKLQGIQGSSQQAHESGLGIAAAGQNRALQAIQAAGQMGGQIRGQSYDEQAKKAAAEDLINRFNTENMQSVASRNVGTRNTAQLQNQETARKLAEYQNQMKQQQFGNKYQIAQGKAGALTGQANQAQKAAESKQKMWGQIGSGAGTLFGGLYQADKDEY